MTEEEEIKFTTNELKVISVLCNQATANKTIFLEDRMNEAFDSLIEKLQRRFNK